MKLHKNKRIENIGKEKQNIRNLMLEGKDESARIRVNKQRKKLLSIFKTKYILG